MMENIEESTGPENLLCSMPDDKGNSIKEHSKGYNLCKMLVRIYFWINGLEPKWKRNLGWQWKIKEWEKSVSEGEKEIQAYLRCLIGKVTMTRMLGRHCALDKVAGIVSGAVDGYIGAFGSGDHYEVCKEVDISSVRMGGRLIWKELGQWINEYHREKDERRALKKVEKMDTALHRIKEAGKICPPEKREDGESRSNTLEKLGISGVDKEPDIRKDTKTWEKGAMEEALDEAKKVNNADELMEKMKDLEQKLEEEYGESAKKAKKVQDAAQPQGRVDSTAGDDVVLPLPSPPNPGHPGTVSGGEAGGGKSISSEAKESGREKEPQEEEDEKPKAPVPIPEKPEPKEPKDTNQTETGKSATPNCDGNKGVDGGLGAAEACFSDLDDPTPAEPSAPLPNEDHEATGTTGPVGEPGSKVGETNVIEGAAADLTSRTPSTGTDTKTPVSSSSSASSSSGSSSSNSGDETVKTVEQSSGPGAGSVPPAPGSHSVVVTVETHTTSHSPRPRQGKSRLALPLPSKYFAVPIKRRRYRRAHYVSGPTSQERVLAHVDEPDDPQEYTLVKKRKQPRSVPTKTKKPKKLVDRRGVGRRTIIDIHLEILDECQREDLHSTKEDFFEILVREFMRPEFIKEKNVPEEQVSMVDVPKEQVRSSGSDSGFREEDFVPQKNFLKEEVPSSDSGFREEDFILTEDIPEENIPKESVPMEHVQCSVSGFKV
ncbi:SICA antigen [Plasmodium coatneyi]|uniref:SICA antigen n=1 Tax=Plasmodium coatneyi TaxID=208452 RepID=A0A1B1E2W4_9APIC|nr:SICA antigen [Plasmodium coatneyi]ANQ09353.1 SICA antigen [Plasmodium coatneyi]